VVEPRGQLGDRPGGLVEGTGGPLEAEPRGLVVDQERLAGRPPPGTRDDDGHRPREPAADAVEGVGGGGELPGAGGERGRLPGGPAHQGVPAGVGGIGGSWGRGNGGSRF
jgi:hypothetical protein